MSATTTKASDGRANNARPRGTSTTQHSTFIARLLETGLTKTAIAREIGTAEKTIWNYQNNEAIPAKGAKRDALEKVSKKYKVPIAEPKQ